MGWNEVKLLSCVRLFATLQTVAYRAPLSMGFSRQEYWSGLPFPSPEEKWVSYLQICNYTKNLVGIPYFMVTQNKSKPESAFNFLFYIVWQSRKSIKPAARKPGFLVLALSFHRLCGF